MWQKPWWLDVSHVIRQRHTPAEWRRGGGRDEGGAESPTTSTGDALTRTHPSPLLSCYLRTFPLQAVIDGELDPEDDPNNQGEDEFDEAEDEQPQHRVTEEEDEEEPAALGQHRETHSHQEPPAPAVEEELVVRE